MKAEKTRRPLFPAWASTLRMKWTRQRCQVALSIFETAALMPSCASEMTSFTPRRPRRVSLRRNSVQIGSASEVPISGVRNVIKGGEEDVHAEKGLQKGDPRSRIHPAQDRKTPRIRSNPRRDSLGWRILSRSAHRAPSRNLPDEYGEQRPVQMLDKPFDRYLIFQV